MTKPPPTRESGQLAILLSSNSQGKIRSMQKERSSTLTMEIEEDFLCRRFANPVSFSTVFESDGADREVFSFGRTGICLFRIWCGSSSETLAINEQGFIYHQENALHLTKGY